MTALLNGDLVGITDIPGYVVGDPNDEDGDSNTDLKATIAYASLSGEFPDTSDSWPVPLFQLEFDVDDYATGESSVNYVVSAAVGFTPYAASATFCFNCFTFDIDADETAVALSDGLLVLRHLFGFSGASLTDAAVGTSATRASAAEITAYLDGNDSQLDIDGDGATEALSDGLLVLRYLFGFRGDSLIVGAVTANATRTTATEIESYIESRITPDG
jgi:hypothetical protein